MKTRTQNSETVFRHGFGRLANFENELPEPEKVAICKKWISENAKRKQIPKAIGFSKWLFEQNDLYFYGDPAIDPDWPRKANRFIDFWRYLSPFGSNPHDAQEGLCRNWKAYTGNDPPRPDLIDTEPVYERECDFLSYGDRYPKAQVGTKYLYALVEIKEEEFESEGKRHSLEFVRVKYIGQTDDPSGRLINHVLYPGNIEKVKWIGGLLNNGRHPQMAIFRTVLTEQANQLERAAFYAFQSCETRMNMDSEFPPLDEALLNIHK